MTQRQPYELGLEHALSAGHVVVSGLLLKHYNRLELNETDVMLIMQLQYFKEQEKNEFPTWDELKERMTVSTEVIADSLQRMMKSGILTIDEEKDKLTGVRYERYNLQPLAKKLGAVVDNVERSAAVDTPIPVQPAAASTAPDARSGTKPISANVGGIVQGTPRAASEQTIFSAFEHEFARPLSPMECETISSWLDQDKHPEPLILLALKEAVFAGKVYFKYIDRILLEWSKNRVVTVQQAKEYSQRFRGAR